MSAKAFADISVEHFDRIPSWVTDSVRCALRTPGRYVTMVPGSGLASFIEVASEDFAVYQLTKNLERDGILSPARWNPKAECIPLSKEEYENIKRENNENN